MSPICRAVEKIPDRRVLWHGGRGKRDVPVVKTGVRENRVRVVVVCHIFIIKNLVVCV